MKTFEEATEACQQMGGFLAEPRSEEVSTALKTLNFTSIWTWIGLRDITEDDTYVWLTDNATLSYTDWYPQEPNSRHERCVGISKSNLQWLDLGCHWTNEYICQANTIGESFCAVFYVG